MTNILYSIQKLYASKLMVSVNTTFQILVRIELQLVLVSLLWIFNIYHVLLFFNRVLFSNLPAYQWPVFKYSVRIYECILCFVYRRNYYHGHIKHLFFCLRLWWNSNFCTPCIYMSYKLKCPLSHLGELVV